MERLHEWLREPVKADRLLRDVAAVVSGIDIVGLIATNSKAQMFFVDQPIVTLKFSSFVPLV